MSIIFCSCLFIEGTIKLNSSRVSFILQTQPGGPGGPGSPGLPVMPLLPGLPFCPLDPLSPICSKILAYSYEVAAHI